MRLTLGVYSSGCLRGGFLTVPASRLYYSPRRPPLHIQLIPTRRGTYSTMANTTLTTSLSLPSGKILTIPTGLFINNKFVPSVTGKTIELVYPYS